LKRWSPQTYHGSWQAMQPGANDERHPSFELEAAAHRFRQTTTPSLSRFRHNASLSHAKIEAHCCARRSHWTKLADSGCMSTFSSRAHAQDDERVPSLPMLSASILGGAALAVGVPACSDDHGYTLEYARGRTPKGGNAPQASSGTGGIGVGDASSGGVSSDMGSDGGASGEAASGGAAAVDPAYPEPTIDSIEPSRTDTDVEETPGAAIGEAVLFPCRVGVALEVSGAGDYLPVIRWADKTYLLERNPAAK
jgi:hypothetical protein